MNPLNFTKILMYVGLNLTTIKFYLSKLATNFYRKLSYLTSLLIKIEKETDRETEKETDRQTR